MSPHLRSHRIRVTRRRWGGALAALAVVAGALTISSPALAALGTVSAGPDQSGPEGSWVQIHGSAPGATSFTWSAVRDPAGEQDHAACTIQGATTLDPKVSCNDDGWFIVTLTATDGTTSQTDTARLTLTNVDPVLTVTAPAPGTAVAPHAVVTLSATFTDPGYVDGHTYVVNWGDGGQTARTPAPEKQDGTGSFSTSHSYGSPGNYTITTTVFDSHSGSQDSKTTSISVVAGQPCARVNGKGRLPHHRRGSGFSFSVACGSAGPVGKTSVWLARHGTLRSGSVSLLRGSGRTATWSGTGKWQRSGRKAWAKGYRYVIKATDKGRRRDWMNVTVRKPTGVVVLHARGVIPRGNITVRN